MKFLIKTTRNSYHFLNELLPLLFNKNNNLFMHNQKRLEKFSQSENTFEGKTYLKMSLYNII